MNTIQKKHTEERKSEPVVVADVITQTTESIEVVETAVPEAKSADPLASFKEKMQEEEKPFSGNAPQKNFMWPILFIFVVALILLVGIFLYKQDQNKSTTAEKVNVASLSPTPASTPEPPKEVDLSKYEIQILNGSGVTGEAGRQREVLEEEGFVISSVGNADNSDFSDTIIQAKKEVEKEFLDKLKSVLEISFTLGETEELSEDASVSIVIILGTKK